MVIPDEVQEKAMVLAQVLLVQALVQLHMQQSVSLIIK